MNAEALGQWQTDDERIQNLAKSLAAIHGPVLIRREEHGIHICMACPECLENVGPRELRSRHLQINAEKYLNIGPYANRFLPQNRDRKKMKGYAQCMKEHGAFSFAKIMSYKPIAERCGAQLSPILVADGSAQRYLVPDGKGNMIPDHPGVTTPLTALKTGHPALDYLESRGYDPILLHRQFGATWCSKEAPEGDEFNRWYRWHADGWKSTPQGRIIFYSFVAGVQVCWQGRYLEMEHEEKKYVWHPYEEAWTERPEWERGDEPIKYNTGAGCWRNRQLCGYDAVCQAAEARAEAFPVCVLTEGPLDAARFPERGMAVLGKNLSEAQTLLLAAKFRGVVLAFDADIHGAGACETAAKTLSQYGIKTCKFFTEEEEKSENKIDVGMLGYAVCADRLNALLEKHFIIEP